MAELEQSLENCTVNEIDSQLNGLRSNDAAKAEEVGAEQTDDAELEAIKVRVREMEEAEKLKKLQSEIQSEMDKQLNITSQTGLPVMSLEEKIEADSRSIYVGNVDYGSTAEELEQHFHGCGSINRVTILCDKYSGHPKGWIEMREAFINFAYIEFSDKESVQAAMALDESLFRGRQIKVMPKRTNRPGISTTNRPPRSRFRRAFRGTVIYRSPRRSFRS